MLMDPQNDKSKTKGVSWTSNVLVNPVSMSVHEEMNKNNCGVRGHPNIKFSTVLLFYIFVSGFTRDT